MKTVVITGGVSGMGLAATKLFLHNGWRVVMADYNQQLGEQVLATLAKTAGEHVMFVQTDVSQAQSVNALKEAAFARFGHVDSVINNAGIFTKGALHEVEEAA